MLNISQKTINSKISCNGIGIHNGLDVKMTLIPAPVNTGIVFRRTDLGEKGIIKANYKNVTATNLGTVISNEFGAKVSTIEHLMAAIWGCGIDNLFIDIDAAEVPIMDGSSEPFIFLLECAGLNIQEEQRKIVEVMKKVRVEDGDKFVEVSPAREFALCLNIDFNHKKIRQQKFEFHSSLTSFKNDISRARTFGFKHEIEHLHSMGLAKGGSLDNAILVDEEGIVNKEGLRYANEFVKHKTIDFIGDIFLSGHYIIGAFNAHKSGHGMNNKFLHKLFEDETAWRMV